MAHLGKYLKRIQESFLRIDILQCVESFMKVIKLALNQPITLVFIPGGNYSARLYHDNHLKRCISGNTISNEHARRNEILKSIDRREFQIWQYK